MPNEFKTIVYQTLEAAGTLIPGEESFNKTLAEQFMQQLQFEIGSQTLRHLPPQHMKPFQELSQTNDEQQISTFLNEHIENYDLMLENCIGNFCQQYIDNSKKYKI